MKTNSIAAAYPLTSMINAFTKTNWSELSFPGVPTKHIQLTERKVFYYHNHSKLYARKLRRGNTEWDTEALSKAKYLPLGLI